MSVRSTGDRAEQSAPQTAHYFVCAARGHFCFFVLLAFKADAQKAKFGIIFISVRDNVLMENKHRVTAETRMTHSLEPREDERGKFSFLGT